jgi:signal transduction histidine kinase
VVDQILSNLVDNAVKYAGSASDRRIHLDVAQKGRWLALTVRDHGSGLQPHVVRRLFRPFSKSAQDAAQSAPGVGLGLALSRRLARSLGGELRLEQNGPLGACFSLTIPVHPQGDGSPGENQSG